MSEKKYLFHLISDIHLEIKNYIPDDIFSTSIPKNIDSIMILAGDIGDPFSKIYKTFLEETKKRYSYVIVIPGNHEYYNDNVKNKYYTKDNIDIIDKDEFKNMNKIRKKFLCEPRDKYYNMEEVNIQMETICNDTNCIYLNSSCYILDNKIKIVGCVLWGHIKEEKNVIINNSKPDIFKYVKVNGNNMDYNIFNDLNLKDKKFIENTINNTDLPILLVTHYPPSKRMLANNFYDSHYNCLYYSNMDIFFTDSILAWFSGHTHLNKTIYIKNIECTNNSYMNNNYLFSSIEENTPNFYKNNYSLVI